MSFASQISKERGQPATVRIGIVTQVLPLLIDVQGTLMRGVGKLDSYLPMVGDYVALLGQSAVSADGSSWLALGRASVSDVATSRLGAIARGLRITSSSGTTTEIGVLRIDNIPVFEGRLYRVWLATSTLFGSTAANDLVEGRFYYGFGVTATAAVIGTNHFGVLSIETRTAGGAQYSDAVGAFLPSPGTGILSVLFTILRTAGAGTVSIPASATYPIHMVVEDMGPDPGNTGISI